jgi:hypothetical protein
MTGPEHLEALARGESGDRAAHLRAWARYLARGGDHDELLAALERVRGAGAAEVLRALGTMWLDEPWVYGDWGRPDPAPMRDGLPQWRVEIDVLVPEDRCDFEWPPPWEHPQIESPVSTYGYGDPLEGLRYVNATQHIWAATEDDARALAEQLLDAYFAGNEVVARRVRAFPATAALMLKPRGPEDLEERVTPVRWQLAEPDDVRLRVTWDSGGGRFEHAEATESATSVAVTIYERFGPAFAPNGMPIFSTGTGGPKPRAVTLELQAPLGDRTLLDGATGRPPDEFGIWDWRLRRERDELVAAIRSSRRRPTEYGT